jgi:hypothetical protein
MDARDIPCSAQAATPKADIDQSIWSCIRQNVPARTKLLRLQMGEAASTSDCGWDHLVSATWESCDGGILPQADGVVLDGGVADLLAISRDHAAAAISSLLARYRFIVLDLCSWSETADPTGWKASCTGIHRTNLALRRAVLGSAACTFKLGRISANGGSRTIYKVYGETPRHRGLVPLQTFRRNHASWPPDKRLVEQGSSTGTETADHVKFTRAASPDGDQFWTKTYLHADGPRIAALEQAIALQAASALETLRRLQPPRAAMLDVMLPIAVEGGSLIFPYDPDAVATAPCHFQDWSHFLPPDLLRSVSILAALHVPFRQLPSVSLHNLCDFQVISQGGEAIAMDFEPNPWVLSLLG